MTMNIFNERIALLGLAAFLAGGCGGGGDELNPVEGKVIYKNQPLKGAVVTFHPKDKNDVTVVRPVGLTDENGIFTLKTGQKVGAPAGEYVVTVICPEPVEPKGKGMSTGPPETQDRLQGAFADHKKSLHKFEIKKGDNKLDPIQLK